MTVSIWRFCHLALAVVSCLFIAIAAITGAILAFEPVSQQVKPYAVNHLETVSVAELIPKMEKVFPELIDLKIENNRFVILHAIDLNGKEQKVYIHPTTMQVFGDVKEQSTFFKNVTTLHRSLFMHGLGRLFMWVSSFLLFLIAVSGIFLIIQRQGGFKYFFSRLMKDNFFQYYHVYLGRLLLLPILIIAISGVYLGMVRLKIIPEEKISHQVVMEDGAEKTVVQKPEQLALFKTMALSEVQSIEFPFSKDPEDYFTVRLKDYEAMVHQYSGAVLSKVPYGTSTTATTLSLDLHTGRKSLIWALVLAAASVNILFFIYSGFTITFKRRGTKIKNKYRATDSTHIILVGSEHGTTFSFASEMHQHLVEAGVKSYITQMDNYKAFPKAQHFIVMASTYGQGAAPANAKKFIIKLKGIQQNNTIHFSVLGFGSRFYRHFCKFASDVHAELCSQSWAVPLLDLHTVNNKSMDELKQWLSAWSAKSHIPVSIAPDQFLTVRKDVERFQVIEKIENDPGVFVLRLQAIRKLKFESGDLLAVLPSGGQGERYYSIAKINKGIQLSIRLHPGGLGSGHLYSLQKGNAFSARIISNTEFHFPKNVPTVICICNGTGIAPFLGMIDQNTKKVAIHLFCGFRHHHSLSLYKNFLTKSLADNKLERLSVAYSREANAHYVNDLVVKEGPLMAHVLKNSGVIMICGSLAMQADVLRSLDAVCMQLNGQSLSFYQENKQILMDCY